MIDNLGRISDLILPEPRKSIWRQRSVPSRALEVPMAQVVRQTPGIVAIVGEFVAGRMSEDMWMHWEGEVRCNASPLHHP
jgi:hypothetical protein